MQCTMRSRDNCADASPIASSRPLALLCDDSGPNFRPVKKTDTPRFRAGSESMVSNVSSGYLPDAVSADIMTASAPARQAPATSVTSARVGRECSIMLSSICVATITGFVHDVCDLNEFVLDDRDFLCRQFHAQIAARDHDAVGKIHDGLDVVQAPRAFLFSQSQEFRTRAV